MIKHILLYSIYYGSYAFAFFVFLIFLRKLLKGRILGMIFWWGILGLFVWARWVEPQQIVVQDVVMDMWREEDHDIVLIADLHLGIYKWVHYLRRVVEEINDIDAEIVVIAGDLTYEPTDGSEESLTALFSPLAEIDMPVLAVLGNHDVQVPGPDIRYPLIRALNHNGVTFLHNDIYELWWDKIVWLGPHLAGEDRVEILDGFGADDNVIVLTHNPDTISKYRNENADLTIVWHTHCGQIRLPYIQDWIRPYTYPVIGDFDCDLTTHDYTQLYITSGLGEVLLPLRFLNPPTVDVLRLR